MSFIESPPCVAGVQRLGVELPREDPVWDTVVVPSDAAVGDVRRLDEVDDAGVVQPVQICQISRRIGCVIPCCNLQSRITQPIL